MTTSTATRWCVGFRIASCTKCNQHGFTSWPSPMAAVPQVIGRVGGDGKPRFRFLAMTHEDHLSRASISLEGLAIGDAFGQMFATAPRSARARVNDNRL